MNSATDQYQAIRDELWQKIEAQKAEELVIRRAELAQGSESALLNQRRIEADSELSKQRSEDNRLRSEQNLLIQELILTVRHMVVFIEEGKFDNKIDKLHESHRQLGESQNNVVRTIEGLILVVLGKGNVSPEDLLQLAKSGLIRYDGELRHNSNVYIVPPLVVNEQEFQDATVKLLAECQAINRNFDEVVADMLPSDIRDNINQVGSLRVRIRQLSKACTAYGAWGELVRVLRSYEGESLMVGEVAKFLKQSGRI
jgi:hypothetical protein